MAGKLLHFRPAREETPAVVEVELLEDDCIAISMDTGAQSSSLCVTRAFALQLGEALRDVAGAAPAKTSGTAALVSLPARERRPDDSRGGECSETPTPTLETGSPVARDTTKRSPGCAEVDTRSLPAGGDSTEPAIDSQGASDPSLGRAFLGSENRAGATHLKSAEVVAANVDARKPERRDSRERPAPSTRELGGIW